MKSYGDPMRNIKNEDRMVFLLTSTAFPYIRDALDLLFLPSGVHYRFRYRKKWLPDEFLVKESVQELQGKDAIIIHIHTKKEKEVNRILEFIPIRAAKIDSVRALGEFLWVRFILGDWMHYHKAHRPNELNEFHELLKKQVPDDSREFVKKIMFFVKKFKIETIPDDPSGESDEAIKNWTLIAGHVGKLEPHQNSIFTKILSIKDMNTREPISPMMLNPHITGYQLNAGRIYSLDVAQYYPGDKEIKPFNLNILTSTIITPIKGEAEIKGKYDLLHFVINSTSSEKTVNTFLSFRASPHEPYLISEPFFNITVHGQWGRVASSLLIFGIGVTLTNVSTQLVELIAGKSVNPAILGMAAIGAVFSSLGLFFLRRT